VDKWTPLRATLEGPGLQLRRYYVTYRGQLPLYMNMMRYSEENVLKISRTPKFIRVAEEHNGHTVIINCFCH
jgi:hypothetical protein